MFLWPRGEGALQFRGLIIIITSRGTVVPSRDDIFIVISVPAQTQEMVDTQDPLPSVGQPLLERARGPFRI